jgi:hypothetical protein
MVGSYRQRSTPVVIRAATGTLSSLPEHYCDGLTHLHPELRVYFEVTFTGDFAPPRIDRHTWAKKSRDLVASVGERKLTRDFWRYALNLCAMIRLIVAHPPQA